MFFATKITTMKAIRKHLELGKRKLLNYKLHEKPRKWYCSSYMGMIKVILNFFILPNVFSNIAFLSITALFTSVFLIKQNAVRHMLLKLRKFSHFLFWQIPSFHLLIFAQQWRNVRANPRQLLELHGQQQRQNKGRRIIFWDTLSLVSKLSSIF